MLGFGMFSCPTIYFYSDHGGAEFTFSGDKFGDESSWGANIDTNADIDSVNAKVHHSYEVLQCCTYTLEC